MLLGALSCKLHVLTLNSEYRYKQICCTVQHYVPQSIVKAIYPNVHGSMMNMAALECCFLKILNQSGNIKSMAFRHLAMKQEFHETGISFFIANRNVFKSLGT